MHIENELYADLIIEDGKLTAESSWIFTADDPVPGNGALLNAARSWAGSVGEPLKIPAVDGRIFAESDEFKVSKIKFEMIDRRRCRIRFTAAVPEQESGGDDEVGGELRLCEEYHEERKSDGSIYRSGRWEHISAEHTAVFPEVGQLFSWEGGSFVCTQCKIDLCCNTCELTARKVVTLMLNGVSASLDQDRIGEKEVTYFVAAGEKESFLASREIGSCTPWAGENYYLTSIESKPFGIIGFEITMKAREVFTRRLEVRRKERFEGFHWTGRMSTSATLLARYQLHRDDLENFRGIVGTEAEWADDGMVIFEMQEEKRSEVEYIVTLEARNPDFLQWKTDGDDDIYEGRVDYKVDMAEIFVSASMAGYVQNASGGFELIADWNYSKSCPFTTSGALGMNYINNIIRTAEVTVTEYIKGSSQSMLSDLLDWNSSRLDDGANIPGNALRLRQKSSDVRTKDGTVYVKLTRIYQLPPDGMSWNIVYWGGL